MVQHNQSGAALARKASRSSILNGINAANQHHRAAAYRRQRHNISAIAKTARHAARSRARARRSNAITQRICARARNARRALCALSMARNGSIALARSASRIAYIVCASIAS